MEQFMLVPLKQSCTYFLGLIIRVLTILLQEWRSLVRVPHACRAAHCHLDNSCRHFQWWRVWADLVNDSEDCSGVPWPQKRSPLLQQTWERMHIYNNDSNLRRLTHSSRLKSATSWWYLRTTFSSLFSSECSLFFRWRVGGQPMMHATRRRLEKATFYAVTYVRQKGRTAVKVSSRVYLTFCIECNKALLHLTQ